MLVSYTVGGIAVGNGGQSGSVEDVSGDGRLLTDDGPQRRSGGIDQRDDADVEDAIDEADVHVPDVDAERVGRGAHVELDVEQLLLVDVGLSEGGDGRVVDVETSVARLLRHVVEDVLALAVGDGPHAPVADHRRRVALLDGDR